MNIRQIEIFVTVARLSSFSAAADKLCIAQSAVSIAIQRLEADLGARLLHRTKRRVELTPTGHAFFSRVQPALAQLEIARTEVDDLESGLHGALLMAAPAIVTQTLLAVPLVAFQRQFPGVKMVVRQAGAKQIEQWALSGEIELGVVAAGNVKKGLSTTALFTLPNVACIAASADHSETGPMSWRQLLESTIVTFPTGYHQRSLIDHHAQLHGLAPRITMECENVAVLLEAVRQGIGTSVLPLTAARNVSGITIRSLEEDEVLDVVLCYRQDYPLSPTSSALIEFLHQRLKGDIDFDHVSLEH